MSKKLCLSLLAIAVHVFTYAQTGFGEAVKINAGWKFILKDSTNFSAASVNDKNWQQVALPHDWSVKGQLSPSLASSTGYLPGGIGWYRRQLDVPQSKKGEKVYLYFEGVYNRSEVFLNGHSLGKRPNGYISFMYDATPYINFGGQNTIAVRVDHSKSADSRWYTGSGIYRDVYVVYANPVHLKQWGVYAFPEVKGRSAVLHVDTEVDNSLSTAAAVTVVHGLIAKDGKTITSATQKMSIAANATGKASGKLKVSNPQLWSIDTPNLYTLKTTVYLNGKIVDNTSTPTGFRGFSFSPDKGFALNGKPMKMKGVCLHHDAGVLGAAVPKEVWKSRLLTLKEIGVNAIRTSHNPQAPDFYALCDELGLLVLNEAYDEWEYPKRKWIEGWNVGTPGFEGSYDIFADWSETDLADMVRRDRNHISVWAWSIGNEVDYPNDPYSHPVLGGDTGFKQAIYGGYKKEAPDAKRLGDIAKRLVAVVKKHDRFRPVTAGLAGVAMSNETEYPSALDITGYNYTESRYGTDHQKYPKRIIYGSETAHDYDAWLAVRDNPFIFGQFLWTGIDYLGESGSWPSRGFYSGLVDFAGKIKPRGYFRQAIWADTPVIRLGTYPAIADERTPSKDAWPVWNYKEGEMIRVVCYTNAAKARLELNGKIIGEKPYDGKTGIISWDVPYMAGKLEVIGLDKNNKEVSHHSITSSKQPHALVIKNVPAVDKNSGVAQILVEVVDENGIPVTLADSEVTCTLSGPGKLLGLEAGNNKDMTDYTDNVHRVFNGQILAYVQATGSTGDITVTFTSPWLKPVEVKVKAE